MFGNFYSSAGVIANTAQSFNLVSPKLSWDFSGVLVFDYLPFGANESDRPRINVWRDAGGESDFSYLIYVSGGKDILTPMPSGRIQQFWGDRRTGTYDFPITSITYLKQKISGIQLGDNFGSSIDLNEDGQVLVIGASGSSKTYAYIKNSSSGWSLKSTLNGDGTSASEGSRVAINNDGSVIVSADPLNDSNGNNAGAVFIYTGDLNGWQFKQKINGESANEKWGSSVAINGNGDIIVIGCENDNDTGFTAGAALVYSGDKINGWNFQRKLLGEGTGSLYGSSVAISEDGNLIMMGGPRDLIPVRGGVLIFTKSSSPNFWSFKQKLEGSLISSLFGFGISSNNNGTVLAVGAPHEYSFIPQPFPPINSDTFTSVRLFTGNIINGWNLKNFFSSDCSVPNKFGENLSLNKEGDILIVGAQSRSCSATQGGAVYICTGNPNNGWGIDNKYISAKNFDNIGKDVKISSNGNVITYSSNGGPSPSINLVDVFNRSTVEKREIIAGIDLFTHTFAEPIFLNPPISEWKIENKVIGETKYSYQFVLGEKNPGINIKLDYKDNCKPVTIPSCSPSQFLVYIGTSSFGCPIFACQFPPSTLFQSENGSLYNINTWAGYGLAGFGLWSFVSGSNTIRSINNTTSFSPQLRQNIGPSGFFVAPNSGINRSEQTVNLSLLEPIQPNDNLFLDANYAYNNGFRSIIFRGVYDSEQIRFDHGGGVNDRISYTESNLDGLTDYLATIVENAYNNGYRYHLTNLETGFRVDVFPYINNTVSNNSIFRRTITGNINWNTFITGITFSAAGASTFPIPISERNFYGMFVNNITLQKNDTPFANCSECEGDCYQIFSGNSPICASRVLNTYVNNNTYPVNMIVRGVVDDDILFDDVIYEDGEYPFWDENLGLTNNCGYSWPRNGAHKITTYTKTLNPNDSLKISILSYAGNLGCFICVTSGIA